MGKTQENEPRIKSIEKGWGDESTFFHTREDRVNESFVDEIKEETKQIGSDLAITVCRGYLNGKLKFEMGASIDVTVVYY